MLRHMLANGPDSIDISGLGKVPCILINKNDQGFVNGAQHQRKDRYMTSTYDTAVFFLGNDCC